MTAAPHRVRTARVPQETLPHARQPRPAGHRRMRRRHRPAAGRPGPDPSRRQPRERRVRPGQARPGHHPGHAARPGPRRAPDRGPPRLGRGAGPDGRRRRTHAGRHGRARRRGPGHVRLPDHLDTRPRRAARRTAPARPHRVHRHRPGTRGGHRPRPRPVAPGRGDGQLRPQRAARADGGPPPRRAARSASSRSATSSRPATRTCGGCTPTRPRRRPPSGGSAPGRRWSCSPGAPGERRPSCRAPP